MTVWTPVPGADHPTPVDAPPAAVVLALVEAASGCAGARLDQLTGALLALGGTGPLVHPQPTGLEPIPRELLDRLRSAVHAASVDRWARTLGRLADHRPDVGLVTVADPGYPHLLLGVRDRPAHLFHRGQLGAGPAPAVAVAGTRRPSAGGAARAARIAGELARRGITVVSGLAEGIDAAAHRATVDAGGRTVAVLGHGILRPVYPRGHGALAERIVRAGGALVSPFLPDQPPTPSTFPSRNVTSSGLALATLVVEAGDRSGARHQARRCLEHGRQLFLCPAVAREPWGRRYASLPGCWVVEDAEGLLERLDRRPLAPLPVQRALG